MQRSSKVEQLPVQRTRAMEQWRKLLPFICASTAQPMHGYEVSSRITREKLVATGEHPLVGAAPTDPHHPQSRAAGTLVQFELLVMLILVCHEGGRVRGTCRHSWKTANRARDSFHLFSSEQFQILAGRMMSYSVALSTFKAVQVLLAGHRGVGGAGSSGGDVHLALLDEHGDEGVLTLGSEMLFSTRSYSIMGWMQASPPRV